MRISRLGIRHTFFMILIFSMFLTAYGAPTIRILVLYTPAASAQRGPANMQNTLIAWSANMLNVIFANSTKSGDPKIYNAELAGIDSINYTEVETHIDAYAVIDGANKGTGPFASLKALRARYAADIILFVRSGSAGHADIQYGNGSDYGDQFYCVATVGQYSLPELVAAHEIGHLCGAMHQLGDQDPTTLCAPKYAHAFEKKSEYHTIMYSIGAVMPYYSNPFVTVNGVAIGDVVSAYNAKVFIDNIAHADSWASTPATVTIQNETIHTQDYGDVVSKGTITINSPFTVLSGGQLYLRSGSNLAKEQNPSIYQEKMPTVKKSVLAVTAFKATNKRGVITLNYTLDGDKEVQFQVYDMQGKLVKEKLYGTRNAGHYTDKIFSVSWFSHKTYIVVMKAGDAILRQTICQ